MSAARRYTAPVVAFGASAGGLEALLQVLPLLQPNGRTRYLVAQHMAKTGHSDLVIRVLARKAAMAVVEATNNAVVLPDTLYVIPAGFDGIFDDGRVHLRPPGPDAHSAPSVNVLFDSVARSAGEEAVAVVLSGAGSDGVVGCRDIKAHGGTVIVQEQASAAIFGMAGAVERENLADLALPPEDIARFINGLTPTVAAAPATERHPLTGSPQLQVLLEALSQRSGVDFTAYRQGTLLRRMDRRAEALGFADMGRYIAQALADPAELDTLQAMFLISWSWFFRDRTAWEQLRLSIAAQLDRKPAQEPYRAWVPGCATGEECYSIAMLVRELDPGRTIQVRGSDLNPDALTAARTARYRDAAFREMPTAMRERYISGPPDRPRVADEIRDACSFHEEDALTVQPPGRYDLVSCRNLLIYMKRELHAHLLGTARQALRPGGLLFLGMSEVLGRDETVRFAQVDPTYRIYRRRDPR